jgi:hypothetical protein
VQVHAAPEDGRQLFLQVEEGEPRDVPGFALHQDVDVALRAEVVAWFAREAGARKKRSDS